MGKLRFGVALLLKKEAVPQDHFNLEAILHQLWSLSVVDFTSKSVSCSKLPLKGKKVGYFYVLREMPIMKYFSFHFCDSNLLMCERIVAMAP